MTVFCMYVLRAEKILLTNHIAGKCHVSLWCGFVWKIWAVWMCTKYTVTALIRAKAHLVKSSAYSPVHILDTILLLTNQIAGKCNRSPMCRSVHVKSWTIMYTYTPIACNTKVKIVLWNWISEDSVRHASFSCRTEKMLSLFCSY